MAITVNYDVPPGVNIAPLLNDEAVTSLERNEPYRVIRGYVVVTQFIWDKYTLVFTVDYKRGHGELTVMSKQFSFVPDVSSEAKQLHHQIYDYIKSLPEFEGAEDTKE